MERELLAFYLSRLYQLNQIFNMRQKVLLDLSKGHPSILPSLNMRTPLMQPTIITKALQDQIFLFESLGVFVMVYGSTCFKQQFGFDLQLAAATMMTFVVCNHPSNSNSNPMITLSFCLRNTKRYQAKLLWVYIKAQFLGAFLGVILAFVLNIRYRSPFVPAKHTYGEYFRIVMSQCVGVFVLVLLALQVVGPNTIYTTKKFSRYIYIILIVYIARKYAPTSGTALNACITLARALLGVWYADWSGLKYYGLWLVGDIIGCLLATLLYNNVVEPCIIHSRIRKIKKQREQEQMIQLETIQRIINN